ncbi:acyl-CoA dehydrogenase family protein [Nocardioides sp.]|uniref:acyl-CoA dehydrogenase family protein n=1 Tax=Nocardioides sp. TaxID=35761 RepID=UPI0035125D09
MRFELDDDQRDFAASLERLLAGADTVKVARAWAEGDHAPGRALWQRLTEQGLLQLALDATPVELCIAFEALGRHAVPGPWVESAAYLPVATGAEVEGIATLALPPLVPRALDADVADVVHLGAQPVAAEAVGALQVSVDRTRRLFDVAGPTPDVHEQALDLAVLATAAQLLGAGERVLADSVSYVAQRTQFGRPIGSYQAIKHALADVRIALDFTRPLVQGAALDPTRRATAAAKVAASDAAYLAARTGLQVHGAIGYTAEFDLSLWLTKIRALVGAWGTPAHHRAVLREDLLAHGAWA